MSNYIRDLLLNNSRLQLSNVGLMLPLSPMSFLKFLLIIKITIFKFSIKVLLDTKVLTYL